MYRVIWKLSDGRKKYSSTNGEPEIWNEKEIDVLNTLTHAAYSEDLKVFMPDKRFEHKIKIIDIVGYEIQKETEPLFDNVIL